jgi:ribonucleoside-triphosphate reductase
MLRLEMDYDSDFCDIYNHYNSTEKGKSYLQLLGINRDKLDIATMSKLYFSDTDSDKTIDINANVGRAKNPNNYQAEIVKGLTKLNGLYLMWDQLKTLYGDEVARECVDSIVTGDLYLHDMTGAGVQVPYCFAWASSNIFLGRNYGQLKSRIPKRSDSFIACCIESIFDLSQDVMGAIAIPDFIINLSYYYLLEGKKPDVERDRYEITNDFQRIVHCLNQQYRISNQSAFTNFSILDRPTMTETFKDYNWPDGSPLNIEYIQRIQEIFVEFMAKKDPSTDLPYRFPITTFNIYISDNYEITDQKFLDMVCKHNTEGIFNIFICRGKAKLASCCRLLSDPAQLREYGRFDSFANAGLSLGSARVATINFVRIGKKASGNTKKFYEILDRKLEKARNILKAQRTLLKKRVDSGFLKFFNMGWMNMSMFFSTFGMNGLFESLQFMGLDIRSEEGLDFTREMFSFIEHKLESFSKQDKIAYNFEQTPSEGCATTLAKLDKIFFGDDQYPFEIYGNQFIPLWIDCDLLERAKIDGQICKFMSGGSICHLNIGCAATSEQVKDLIRFAISTGLEHFALNPSFNICENDHVSLGKSIDSDCPKCGAKIVDNITRVVGYFTKVSNWDKVRRDKDFPNRKFNYFDENPKLVSNC